MGGREEGRRKMVEKGREYIEGDQDDCKIDATSHLPYVLHIVLCCLLRLN